MKKNDSSRIQKAYSDCYMFAMDIDHCVGHVCLRLYAPELYTPTRACRHCPCVDICHGMCMCICVCMCIYMCICVRVCVRVCRCTYTGILMYVYVHVCIYIYILKTSRKDGIKATVYIYIMMSNTVHELRHSEAAPGGRRTCWLTRFQGSNAPAHHCSGVWCVVWCVLWGWKDLYCSCMNKVVVKAFFPTSF